MKPNLKLTLALLTGVALGLAPARTIHAEQPKTPPAYVVAEVEVTDPATMQKYGAQVPATLAPFNHHYVIPQRQVPASRGRSPKRRPGRNRLRLAQTKPANGGIPPLQHHQTHPPKRSQKPHLHRRRRRPE